MPLAAMPWNQPITSPNVGEEVAAPGWPPAAIAPTADKASAAAATPAATYWIAGMLRVCPFPTVD